MGPWEPYRLALIGAWEPYRLALIGAWEPYTLAVIGPKLNNNTTATIDIHLKVIKFEFIYLLLTLKIDMHLAPIK